MGTKFNSMCGCDVLENHEEQAMTTANKTEAPNWLLSSEYSIPAGQVDIMCRQIRRAPRQSRGATVSSVQIHASISPLVGHAASLTSILSECVACDYYNLICKPLHGSYVTAGMSL